MNTYENDLYQMLSSGMSIDELLAQLHNAESKYKADKAAAQRKEVSETRAKDLVDICNRAMENKLTAADVAYVQHLYIAQNYPEHTRMLFQMFSSDEFDSAIQMAINTVDALTPLVHLAGAKDWDEVLDAIEAEVDQSHPHPHSQKKNDDAILRDFINTIKK